MELDITNPTIRLKALTAAFNPDYAEEHKITFGLDPISESITLTGYGKKRQSICSLNHWGCAGEATETNLFNQKICKSCFSKEMKTYDNGKLEDII